MEPPVTPLPPEPPADARRSAQVALAAGLAVLVGLLAVRGYGHGLRTRPTEPAAVAGGFDPNRADVAELEQVPGFGPATARAIVADRLANGPYRDADDLDRVPGVGPAAVGKVRPYLTVRGQSPPDDPPLPARPPPAATSAAVGKVRPGDPPINVNTASEAELQRLPGVGPVTAANIVAGRPFRTVQELDRVPKIGPKTLDKLRPFVVVR